MADTRSGLVEQPLEPQNPIQQSIQRMRDRSVAEGAKKPARGKRVGDMLLDSWGKPLAERMDGFTSKGQRLLSIEIPDDVTPDQRQQILAKVGEVLPRFTSETWRAKHAPPPTTGPQPKDELSRDIPVAGRAAMQFTSAANNALASPGKKPISLMVNDAIMRAQGMDQESVDSMAPVPPPSGAAEQVSHFVGSAVGIGTEMALMTALPFLKPVEGASRGAQFTRGGVALGTALAAAPAERAKDRAISGAVGFATGGAAALIAPEVAGAVMARSQGAARSVAQSALADAEAANAVAGGALGDAAEQRFANEFSTFLRGRAASKAQQIPGILRSGATNAQRAATAAGAAGSALLFGPVSSLSEYYLHKVTGDDVEMPSLTDMATSTAEMLALGLVHGAVENRFKGKPGGAGSSSSAEPAGAPQIGPGAASQYEAPIGPQLRPKQPRPPAQAIVVKTWDEKAKASIVAAEKEVQKAHGAAPLQTFGGMTPVDTFRTLFNSELQQASTAAGVSVESLAPEQVREAAASARRKVAGIAFIDRTMTLPPADPADPDAVRKLNWRAAATKHANNLMAGREVEISMPVPGRSMEKVGLATIVRVEMDPSMKSQGIRVLVRDAEDGRLIPMAFDSPQHLADTFAFQQSYGTGDGGRLTTSRLATIPKGPEQPGPLGEELAASALGKYSDAKPPMPGLDELTSNDPTDPEVVWAHAAGIGNRLARSAAAIASARGKASLPGRMTPDAAAVEEAHAALVAAREYGVKVTDEQVVSMLNDAGKGAKSTADKITRFGMALRKLVLDHAHGRIRALEQDRLSRHAEASAEVDRVFGRGEERPGDDEEPPGLPAVMGSPSQPPGAPAGGAATPSAGKPAETKPVTHYPSKSRGEDVPIDSMTAQHLQNAEVLQPAGPVKDALRAELKKRGLKPKEAPREPKQPAPKNAGQPGVAGPVAVDGRPDGGRVRRSTVTAPAVGEGGERVVVSRADLTAAADESAVPEGLAQHLTPYQRQGVALAVRSMDDRARGGFLLADGTGVGKTRQILSVAEKYRREGKHVVIFVPNEVIGKPWEGKNIRANAGLAVMSGSYAKDAEAMGLKVQLWRPKDGPMPTSGITVTTYTYITDHAIPEDRNAVYVFDESHNLKNATSTWSRRGRTLINKAHAVLFASATPADKPMHIEYLARIGILEGKTLERAVESLGLRLYNSPQYGPKWVPMPGVKLETILERMAELFDRMTKNGSMVKREISLKGVDIGFRRIAMSPETQEKLKRIDAAFPHRATALMHARRQQEPDKIPAAMEIAKAEIAEGRRVIFFVSRVNASEALANRIDANGEQVKEFIAGSRGTAELLAEELKKAGLSFVELHGNADEHAASSVARFQSGDADAMVATIESGGTGINLDDTVGDSPRTIIFLTAPFNGVSNVQAVGRAWRLTTKSFPRVVYLFGDTEVDKWNAAIIARKMQMLGASVSGEVKKINIDPDLISDTDAENVGELADVMSDDDIGAAPEPEPEPEPPATPEPEPEPPAPPPAPEVPVEGGVETPEQADVDAARSEVLAHAQEAGLAERRKHISEAEELEHEALRAKPKKTKAEQAREMELLKKSVAGREAGKKAYEEIAFPEDVARGRIRTEAIEETGNMPSPDEVEARVEQEMAEGTPSINAADIEAEFPAVAKALADAMAVRGTYKQAWDGDRNTYAYVSGQVAGALNMAVVGKGKERTSDEVVRAILQHLESIPKDQVEKIDAAHIDGGPYGEKGERALWRVGDMIAYAKLVLEKGTKAPAWPTFVDRMDRARAKSAKPAEPETKYGPRSITLVGNEMATTDEMIAAHRWLDGNPTPAEAAEMIEHINSLFLGQRKRRANAFMSALHGLRDRAKMLVRGEPSRPEPEAVTDVEEDTGDESAVEIANSVVGADGQLALGGLGEIVMPGAIKANGDDADVVASMGADVKSFEQAFRDALDAREAPAEAVVTASRISGSAPPADFDAERTADAHRREALERAGQSDMFGGGAMLGERGNAGEVEASSEKSVADVSGKAKVAEDEGITENGSHPVELIRFHQGFQNRSTEGNSSAEVDFTKLREAKLEELIDPDLISTHYGDDGFSRRKIEDNPPVVWRDTQGYIGRVGQLWMLSGHHRAFMWKNNLPDENLPLKILTSSLDYAVKYANLSNRESAANTHSELARMAFRQAAGGADHDKIAKSLKLKSASEAERLVQFAHVDSDLRSRWFPSGAEGINFDPRYASSIGAFVMKHPDVFTKAVQAQFLRSLRSPSGDVMSLGKLDDVVRGWLRDVVSKLPEQQRDEILSSGTMVSPTDYVHAAGNLIDHLRSEQDHAVGTMKSLVESYLRGSLPDSAFPKKMTAAAIQKMMVDHAALLPDHARATLSDVLARMKEVSEVRAEAERRIQAASANSWESSVQDMANKLGEVAKYVNDALGKAARRTPLGGGFGAMQPVFEWLLHRAASGAKRASERFARRAGKKATHIYVEVNGKRVAKYKLSTDPAAHGHEAQVETPPNIYWEDPASESAIYRHVGVNKYAPLGDFAVMPPKVRQAMMKARVGLDANGFMFEEHFVQTLGERWLKDVRMFEPNAALASAAVETLVAPPRWLADGSANPAFQEYEKKNTPEVQEFKKKYAKELEADARFIRNLYDMVAAECRRYGVKPPGWLPNYFSHIIRGTIEWDVSDLTKLLYDREPSDEEKRELRRRFFDQREGDQNYEHDYWVSRLAYIRFCAAFMSKLPLIHEAKLYLGSLEARIDPVSAEAVKAAAERWLFPRDGTFSQMMNNWTRTKFFTRTGGGVDPISASDVLRYTGMEAAQLVAHPKFKEAGARKIRFAFVHADHGVIFTDPAKWEKLKDVTGGAIYIGTGGHAYGDASLVMKPWLQSVMSRATMLKLKLRAMSGEPIDIVKAVAERRRALHKLEQFARRSGTAIASTIGHRLAAAYVGLSTATTIINLSGLMTHVATEYGLRSMAAGLSRMRDVSDKAKFRVMLDYCYHHGKIDKATFERLKEAAPYSRDEVAIKAGGFHQGFAHTLDTALSSLETGQHEVDILLSRYLTNWMGAAEVFIRGWSALAAFDAAERKGHTWLDMPEVVSSNQDALVRYTLQMQDQLMDARTPIGFASQSEYLTNFYYDRTGQFSGMQDAWFKTFLGMFSTFPVGSLVHREMRGLVGTAHVGAAAVNKLFGRAPAERKMEASRNALTYKASRRAPSEPYGAAGGNGDPFGRYGKWFSEGGASHFDRQAAKSFMRLMAVMGVFTVSSAATHLNFFTGYAPFTALAIVGLISAMFPDSEELKKTFARMERGLVYRAGQVGGSPVSNAIDEWRLNRGGWDDAAKAALRSPLDQARAAALYMSYRPVRGILQTWPEQLNKPENRWAYDLYGVRSAYYGLSMQQKAVHAAGWPDLDPDVLEKARRTIRPRSEGAARSPFGSGAPRPPRAAGPPKPGGKR